MSRAGSKFSPRIGYQGERGAFSEQAARQLHSAEAKLFPCHDFASLFAALKARKIDLVVAPVENAIAGKVTPVEELLLGIPHHVLGEVRLPIAMALIAVPGARFKDIRSVESHPVALAQCRQFLAAHPQITATVANDTAASVRRIMESRDITRAAIASTYAAEVYGAQILRENIQDRKDNWTRFLLLEHATQNDKNPHSSGGRP